MGEAVASAISYHNRTSPSTRELIPDCQFGNAPLRLYDDQRKADYLATVVAFRAEFHRLRDSINETKTVEELGKMKQKLPSEILKAETP